MDECRAAFLMAQAVQERYLGRELGLHQGHEREQRGRAGTLELEDYGSGARRQRERHYDRG